MAEADPLDRIPCEGCPDCRPELEAEEVEEVEYSAGVVRYTFDTTEAKGQVELWRGAFGVRFTVTSPDGVEYSGFLDLFHFVPGADHLGCFQVVVDPVGGEGGTFHARFYPDGRVETITE
jgi:hypothetical protein